MKYPIAETVPIINMIAEQIAPFLQDFPVGHPLQPKGRDKWWMVAGSIRRKGFEFKTLMQQGKSTDHILVGDIELCVVEKSFKVCKEAQWDSDLFGNKVLKGREVVQGELYDYLQRHIKYGGMWSLRKGEDDKEVFGPENKLLIFKDTTRKGIRHPIRYKLDIFSSTEEAFVSNWLVRTGSKANNINVMLAAKQQNVKLAFMEGCFKVPKNHPRLTVWRRQYAKQWQFKKFENETDTHFDRFQIDSEAMIYEFLGLKYLSPNER